VDIDIGLLASFGAGLVSFLSPCILPLVPPYLCFLAGTSLSELTADRTVATTALARALAFVIGFTCVFVALGASASTIGRLVSDHLALLSRIAGIVIAVLGLHMVGMFRIPVLMRQARFETVGPPASMAGAFAVGLAFGFGWTPCVGPVLASVLLLAGTEARSAAGTLHGLCGRNRCRSRRCATSVPRSPRAFAPIFRASRRRWVPFSSRPGFSSS
jgi:cytochrome c-type biogenesis protein